MSKSKQKQVLKPIAGALFALFAINSANAQISINSSTSYASQLTQSKYKEIADAQAQDEVRWILVNDILQKILNNQAATATSSATQLDGSVLTNGATYSLYDSGSSIVGSLVSSEPVVHVGAGSRQGTGGIANVGGISLAGNTYTFAGGTTSGEVVFGDLVNGNYRTLTGVAAGRISATSTDGINGSQLHATNQALTTLNTKVNQGFNVATAYTSTNIQMGDTLRVDYEDPNIIISVTNDRIGLSLSDNVTANTFSAGSVGMGTAGISAGNFKIRHVEDGTIDATSKDAVNGSQLYAVDQKTITNATNITNLTNRVNQGINFVADTGTQNVQLGDTFGIKGSTNVTTSISGGDTVISLKDNIALNSVTTGNASISTTGVNAGNMKVTNVADGAVNATSKDAVNGSQLYAVDQKVADVTTNVNNVQNQVNQGFNVAVNGTTGNIQMGDTLTLDNTDNNIVLGFDATGKTVTVNLANDVTANSFTAGTVSVATTGIDAGSLKITNVADGAVNATSKEAINGSQLYNALQNFDVGNVVKYDGTTQDTVTFAGTNGTLLTNVKAGDISANSSDAVNGSQLYAVDQKVNTHTTNITNLTNRVNQGINFVGDTGSQNVHLGDTFGIKGGNNIVTTVSNGNATVALANDIKVNSVTTGNVSMSSTGINAGDTRITNVAEGVNGTDAVNVNQLNKAISGFVDNSARINEVDSDAKSGIAAAMAVGTLGQAWEPGASTISVSGSTYAGKTGWAIGGSTMTENGKWLLKYNVSGSGNGKFGGAGSVTYQY